MSFVSNIRKARGNFRERFFTGGVGAGVAATSLLVTGINHIQAQTAPNIVLFLVDDMGWKDVSYNSSLYAKTPNIDKLASEGMVFTNAYACAANCAPSRACLLSGQYTPRHGVYTVGSSDQGATENKRLIPVPNNDVLNSAHITVAEALKAAGYITGIVGKYHLGDDPSTQGFDFNRAGCSWGSPDSYFSPYDMPNLTNGPAGEYLTDRLTEEALTFINANKDKKFFLYFPHYAVHTPIQSKQDKINTYSALYPNLSNAWVKYLAMIESVDESVGKVLETLKLLGLEGNTAVILSSDNGGIPSYTSLEPLRGTKGMLYEGGIREPFIVKWPGHIKAGTTCDVPVIHTDLYPTILEITGAAKPQAYELDGESILPLLIQSGGLSREAVFWHSPIYLNAAYGVYELFRNTPSTAMRKGPWKMIEFFETGNIALYNINNDIGEANDLAEFLPDTVNMLYQVMETWRNRVKAPMTPQKNSGFVPLFKYTSFPKQGQVFDAAGKESVTLSLAGNCMNTEIDSVKIRIYHKASLYAELNKKMTFSNGVAPFSFTTALKGSEEKYKFKVCFIRNVIEEVDTIVKDVGVSNFTDVINSFNDNYTLSPRVTVSSCAGKKIKIAIQGNRQERISARVWDIKGKLLYTDLDKNSCTFKHEIVLNYCSNGLYLLEITIGSVCKKGTVILTK